MPHPLVVHCKRSEYDVYIGRPSQWGNPFKVGPDGTRAEVIAKYARVLKHDLMKMEKAHRLLKGKVLGCWCAPAPCHGDVLAEIANAD